ncbi:MAG: M14 family metallopeptidase [Planctomycetes bacterium]|nr:M14 family metallopeptidase [Planctomycetota bacterium]
MKIPLTRAERTDYRETSLHKDVIEFVQSLRAQTKEVLVESMGRSGEGQDMPVLVLGATSPEDARRRGKPVLLVIANIHAGEVEGKEAILMLARDMTLGPLARYPEKLCLVLVPNYNPDGNDRISKENRKLDLEKLEGQINPEGGVGTRYTGKGINLNRDYMKLEADESRHLAKLYNRWWPHITMDCHTTDGSIHAYHLTYDSANNVASCPAAPVEYVRGTMLPAISRSLEKRTGLRTFFYGNYRNQDDPASGWETYSPLPRYGSNYRGLTGCMDVLLEAYSYVSFRERTVVTIEILKEIFDYAIAHAEEVVRINDSATQPKTVGIEYGPAEDTGEIEIRAFDLESIRARRFTGTVTPFRCRWYSRFVPTKSVERPAAYLIRSDESAAIRKLRDHGIVLEPLRQEALDAEVYTVESVEKTSSPDVGNETRFETVVRATRARCRVEVRDGDLLVRTDQRLGTVAVYLLEPESDDGLVRWGYFDGSLATGREFGVCRVP